MVAEDQVATAAVNVDLLAQVAHRHRRALDVPAGPARPEPRRPAWLAGAGWAPEREIQPVALGARPDPAQQLLLPQLAQHRAARPPGELAEAGGAGGFEIKAAIGGRRGEGPPPQAHGR